MLLWQRVEANGEWSLFCPSEAPGLADCWGAEHEALYAKYEAEGRAKKVIRAQALWFAIMDAQVTIGTHGVTMGCRQFGKTISDSAAVARLMRAGPTQIPDGNLLLYIGPTATARDPDPLTREVDYFDWRLHACHPLEQLLWSPLRSLPRSSHRDSSAVR